VGEGGDQVSIAWFIASQRAEHGVPQAVCCRDLDVSVSVLQAERPATDAATAATRAAERGDPGDLRSLR
jgi:hypothetical protein